MRMGVHKPSDLLAKCVHTKKVKLNIPLEYESYLTNELSTDDENKN